jgi:methylated-DNA-[protein]-cysteine S-methyltransferase
MTVPRPAAALRYFTTLPSPIGELLLISDGAALTGIYMPPHKGAPEVAADWTRDPAPLRAAVEQLEEYFAGERTAFDLPLAPRGTAFQLRVWAALGEIPYGRTESYGRLAARVGNPRAVRAVGLANGRNPLSIVVPCHRVIGANGSLTGYGGGLDRKTQLLALERQHAASTPALPWL